MKSFIKNDWNIYDSLPNQYTKMFTFQNINRIKKRVKEIHDEEIVAIQDVYLTLLFDASIMNGLSSFKKEYPVIVSSLFKHETKVSLNHCRVKFHNLNEEPMVSKKNYVIHCGFRKYEANIFLSAIYPNVNKYKFIREVEPNYNNWHLISFF